MFIKSTLVLKTHYIYLLQGRSKVLLGLKQNSFLFYHFCFFFVCQFIIWKSMSKKCNEKMHHSINKLKMAVFYFICIDVGFAHRFFRPYSYLTILFFQLHFMQIQIQFNTNFWRFSDFRSRGTGNLARLPPSPYLSHNTGPDSLWLFAPSMRYSSLVN